MVVCPICTGGDTSKDRELYDDRFGYPGTFPLFSCGSCGHRWLAVALADAELEALYADYYPRRDLAVADIPARRTSTPVLAWWRGERAAAAAWVAPGLAVLDIGCGAGEALAFHQQRGCVVRGVEADAHAVRLARARGLEVDHGVFEPERYRAGSFDVVTLDQVLEHMRDPIETLRGVAGVLRRDGRAVIAMPNAAGAIARISGNRWIHWHAPYHLHFFTRASLATAAGRAGLVVDDVPDDHELAVAQLPVDPRARAAGSRRALEVVVARRSPPRDPRATRRAPARGRGGGDSLLRRTGSRR